MEDVKFWFQVAQFAVLLASIAYGAVRTIRGQGRIEQKEKEFRKSFRKFQDEVRRNIGKLQEAVAELKMAAAGEQGAREERRWQRLMAMSKEEP